MSARWLSISLATLLITAPALAQDEDMDLDSLMSEDREVPEDEKADTDEDADSEGEGEDVESPPDYQGDRMVDEERPPGDSDAFVKPKAEQPAEVTTDEVVNPFSVGVLAGYGLNFDGPANAWGLGFGVRGGYDLGLVSFGLRFMYYLGESATENVPDRAGQLYLHDVSRNFWEVSVDAGLDLDIGKLTLRPGLGIGLAVLTLGESSNVAPSLAPSLTVTYNATDSFYVGLELRYQVIASETSASGFSPVLGLGMRF